MSLDHCTSALRCSCRFRRSSCCLRHPYGVILCGLYTFSTRITSNTSVPPTECINVLPSALSSSLEVVGSAVTSAKELTVRDSTSKTTVARIVSRSEMRTQ